MSAVNNNERTGANWGNGGGWNDATNDVPDWVQINFNGSKTIDRVVVYTLQDNYNNPDRAHRRADLLAVRRHRLHRRRDGTAAPGSPWPPSPATTWSSAPSTFTAFTTDRIRVSVTNALQSYSRITEIEAWGVAASAAAADHDDGLTSSPNPRRAGDTVHLHRHGDRQCADRDRRPSPRAGGAMRLRSALTVGPQHRHLQHQQPHRGHPQHRRQLRGGCRQRRLGQCAVHAGHRPPPPAGGTNVALASAGAVASASSTYSADYPVSAVNNNERTGASWGNGGGWNDATAGAYPDSVQILFNGSKTIDRVVVYTLQDNYSNPSRAHRCADLQRLRRASTSRSQGWTGSAWVTLGTVTGNNRVKRTVTFAPFTTDRIRVNITNALASFSRLTEIEAWTSGAWPSLADGIPGVLEKVITDPVKLPRIDGLAFDRFGNLFGVLEIVNSGGGSSTSTRQRLRYRRSRSTSPARVGWTCIRTATSTSRANCPSRSSEASTSSSVVSIGSRSTYDGANKPVSGRAYEARDRARQPRRHPAAPCRQRVRHCGTDVHRRGQGRRPDRARRAGRQRSDRNWSVPLPICRSRKGWHSATSTAR